MDKSALYNITYYFSGTMFASSMASTVTKVRIVQELGNPIFIGLMYSFSTAIFLALDIGLSYIADTKSRRTMALFANICLGACSLSLLYITPSILFITFALNGLGMAFLAGVPGAIVMEHTERKERRLKLLSRMEVFCLAGSLIGNGLGIWIFMSHPEVVFVTSALLFFMVAAMTFHLLPTNRTTVNRARARDKAILRDFYATAKEIFSKKEVLIVFCIVLVLYLMSNVTATYWIIYFSSAKTDMRTVDFAFIALSSSFVIVAKLISNLISSYFPVHQFKFIVVVMALLFLLPSLYLQNNNLIFTIIIALSFLIERLFDSVVYVYFQNYLSDDRRATFSSTFSTILAIIGIGPVLAVAPLMKTHLVVTLVGLSFASMALFIVLIFVVSASLENASIIKDR
ncbi:MAG: MFS transporter [Hyphomicrobiales bacterium]